MEDHQENLDLEVVSKKLEKFLFISKVDKMERYNRLIADGKNTAKQGNIHKALDLFKVAYNIFETQKLKTRISKIEELLAQNDEEDEELEFVNVNNSGLNLFRELHDKLYDYQRDGVSFLYGLYRDGRKGGILADDMGLGKTIQVISFLSGMYDNELVKHTLLIMPTSLITNWIKEFAKWTPGMRVKEFHSTSKAERTRSLETVQRRNGVIITTYTMLMNNWQQLSYRGKEFCWDYVILDEAHKIKNTSTKTTKSAYAIPSKNRILLTGTPVQNNLREMWTLFDFACQGALLGTAKTFIVEYENPITRAREKDATPGEKALGSRMSENLMTLIKPYFLRRTKSEVQKMRLVDKEEHLDNRDIKVQSDPANSGAVMPKLTRKNDLIVWTYLSRIQEDIYTQFIGLDHIKELLLTTRSPLAELNILKKLCDHPRLLSAGAIAKLGLQENGASDSQSENIESDNNSIANVPDENLISESGKLVFLLALLERLREEGHRTLVFAHYRKVLDIIQRILSNRGFKVLRLDGTITQITERERLISLFQKDKRYSVFLLTTQVGGVGITLTAADRVVIYDPSWNPATDAQAVDRVYRIGQTENVIIYRLITCGTVEEKIYRRQVFKDSLIRQNTGDTKNPFRYFSRQELRELFTLKDTRSSSTQLQLQAMHSRHRQTDPELDEHIAHLHTMDMFGISDHDLMFSLDINHDEALENQEEHHYIEGRVQKAQELMKAESELNMQLVQSIVPNTEPAWTRMQPEKNKKKSNEKKPRNPKTSPVYPQPGNSFNSTPAEVNLDLSGSGEDSQQNQMDQSPSGEESLQNLTDQSGSGGDSQQDVTDQSGSGQDSQQNQMDQSGSGEDSQQNLMDQSCSGEDSQENLTNHSGSGEESQQNLTDHSGSGEDSQQDRKDQSGSGRDSQQDLKDQSGSGKESQQNRMDQSGSGRDSQQNLMDQSCSGGDSQQDVTDQSGSGEDSQQNRMDQSGSGEDSQENLTNHSGSGEESQQNLTDHSGSGEDSQQDRKDQSGSGRDSQQDLKDQSGSGEDSLQNLTDQSGSGEDSQQDLTDQSGSGEDSQQNLMDQSGSGVDSQQNLMDKSGSGEDSQQDLTDQSCSGEDSQQNLTNHSGSGEESQQNLTNHSGSGEDSQQDRKDQSGSGRDSQQNLMDQSCSGEESQQNFMDQSGSGGDSQQDLTDQSGSGEDSQQNLMSQSGSGEDSQQNLTDQSCSGVDSQQDLTDQSCSGVDSHQNLKDHCGSGEDSQHDLTDQSCSGEDSHQNLKDHCGSGEDSQQNVMSQSGSGEDSQQNLTDLPVSGEDSQQDLTDQSCSGEDSHQNVMSQSGSGEDSQHDLMDQSCSGVDSHQNLKDHCGSGEDSQQNVMSQSGSGEDSQQNLTDLSVSGEDSQQDLTDQSCSGEDSHQNVMSQSGSGEDSQHDLMDQSGSGVDSHQNVMDQSGSGEDNQQNLGSKARDIKENLNGSSHAEMDLNLIPPSENKRLVLQLSNWSFKAETSSKLDSLHGNFILQLEDSSDDGLEDIETEEEEQKLLSKLQMNGSFDINKSLSESLCRQTVNSCQASVMDESMNESMVVTRKKTAVLIYDNEEEEEEQQTKGQLSNFFQVLGASTPKSAASGSPHHRSRRSLGGNASVVSLIQSIMEDMDDQEFTVEQDENNDESAEEAEEEKRGKKESIDVQDNAAGDKRRRTRRRPRQRAMKKRRGQRRRTGGLRKTSRRKVFK
ncbi:DNA excision repair protein ERCC-6-like [Melanotaenia boesemani]|uniref:DNA excision repair protein ERCC-6-like n=1 Tax=Melanotaenia boesemani TaxID=1250792 RepID=UPI001C058692|nr:DNA excision repair protein ERCC-6-like [Melanotaenia boesemani]